MAAWGKEGRLVSVQGWVFISEERTHSGGRGPFSGGEVSLACGPHAGRALSASTAPGAGLEGTPDSQGWQNHCAGRKEVKQIGA